MERQLTPNSPLELAESLADLGVSPAESSPPQLPPPQQQRLQNRRSTDVITLL